MTTISNPTYVLRTCDSNLQGHNGFQWPRKGFVEAPDWNPEPVCGGGLHGLLMGKGSSNLLNWESDAIWQVVEVQENTIVSIDNEKVKFPYGNVVYSGNRKDATDLLISFGAVPKDVPGEYQIGGDNAKLIGGDGSTLTGGDNAKLIGDDGSTLQGGDYSILTGGSFSTVQGADHSTVQGGDWSTLTGGDFSNVQGGNRSNLTGGVFSTLQGGDFSTVQGGDFSTVEGGDGSTLTGGEGSTLQGVDGCNFKAGKNSCFVGSSWKDGRKRLITVYVGEDDIKADTWYRFENGVFTKFVDK